MQRLRLEWFYRLCLEPRRLLRRYTIDIVRFLVHCRKYRMDPDSMPVEKIEGNYR